MCLAQNDLDKLREGDYEVVIDSSLESGSLTYAECLIPGACAEEVLLSCHICHPSLCNDNLSGIALVLAFLGAVLRSVPLRYSYRLLFIPGTRLDRMVVPQRGVSGQNPARARADRRR